MSSRNKAGIGGWRQLLVAENRFNVKDSSRREAGKILWDYKGAGGVPGLIR
jgi:hypothetical protein